MPQTAVEAKCTNESEYDFKIMHRMIWEHLYVRMKFAVWEGQAGKMCLCFSLRYSFINCQWHCHKKIHWRLLVLLTLEANMKEKSFFGANALSGLLFQLFKKLGLIYKQKLYLKKHQEETYRRVFQNHSFNFIIKRLFCGSPLSCSASPTLPVSPSLGS